MRNHLIAIQGSVASFHDLAAKKYFGEEVTIVECPSFQSVCEKIKNSKADYGIIAIENKVAGSILLNYQLIEEYDLKIIGETYLPIELQLFANKGAKLAEIKEIVSHPMALGQSQNFLTGLENVVVSEYKDTSTCAKLVGEDKSNKLGVIAGSAVGKKYGLQSLVENVGDVKRNFTRFYIISKGEDYVANSDKASVTITLNDKPGCLLKVLEVLNKYSLNLTKIQSVPIPEDMRNYSFHLDIEFDQREKLDKVLTEIRPLTNSLKVLGIYKGDTARLKTLSDITKNLN